MAGQLRPNPPSRALWPLKRWKKRFKKSYFFVNGPALYPPPLLMARPLREDIFFLRLPLISARWYLQSSSVILCPFE